MLGSKTKTQSLVGAGKLLTLFHFTDTSKPLSLILEGLWAGRREETRVTELLTASIASGLRIVVSKLAGCHPS